MQSVPDLGMILGRFIHLNVKNFWIPEPPGIPSESHTRLRHIEFKWLFMGWGCCQERYFRRCLSHLAIANSASRPASMHDITTLALWNSMCSQTSGSAYSHNVRECCCDRVDFQSICNVWIKIQEQNLLSTFWVKISDLCGEFIVLINTTWFSISNSSPPLQMKGHLSMNTRDFDNAPYIWSMNWWPRDDRKNVTSTTIVITIRVWIKQFVLKT